MSILIDRNTRLVVQGMTGREGTFHTEQMQAFGTNVVGGISPGKGGTSHLGVPVFNTVAEAVDATGANTAAVFVPPPFAADAIMEAAAAGVGLVVAITEGIPVLDMVRARALVHDQVGSPALIGGNCPGLISPGEKAKVGIIPNHIARPGRVGIVSRSGTLTYEILGGLGSVGLGVSTCVGIGGDPVLGLTFKDVLGLFASDPDTDAVLMAGEIGGSDEEQAAELIGSGYPKPVYGFIGGRTAPPGKRMGHAGAIISGNTGSPQGKVEALNRAGVEVADTIEELVALVANRLGAGAST
ncbi:MAG TPA: succinate--CoA ligase subunit alpha [Candidatus Dormibacteraeota bacterium]|jgi:succinyl-CoA synthetase alpha subunit|nr:succinate--CoA ligase subunit alpha [Candidatus Dormibacteraeota bacterium]